ncbi:hypothetical protein E3N88_41512 [Mikania micrantha]|uniref:Helicase ATP-binding domain-containing protein n=1 Tax=Mikania micrantha TaxID=192012 RepID=A0A5N6LKE8_9ASTR|nr:hypothetical protein E3N88_41512 [Mikania micrantha]
MANTGIRSNSKQKQQKNRKHQDLVKEVPLTFSSTTHYMNSFIYLLLEETRADLLSHITQISQAPASPISGLQRLPTVEQEEDMYYHITLLNGMNYDPQVGDLIALTQAKPNCIDDLVQPNSLFLTGYVTRLINKSPMDLCVLSSHLLELNPFERNERAMVGFVVYLTNLTTNMRIWQALNPAGNMNIIQRTLSFSSTVARTCDMCWTDGEKGVTDLKLRQSFESFKLDASQNAAVLSCLAATNCHHENSCVNLVWGPPGTGKTKTVASLLFMFLRMKHRTLICAPTNIAVIGVAKRLLHLVHDHDLDCDTYGLGDIVLFGNQERMRIKVDHQELLNVFLDNRIDVLRNCLSRWKTYTGDMIRLLENPMQLHQSFVALKKTETKIDNYEENRMTFEEFVINRFSVLGKDLVACIRNLYTHLPSSMIPFSFAKKMNHSIDLIQIVVESVKEIVTRNQSLKAAFDKRVKASRFMKLRLCKTECLQALKDLRSASLIPKHMNEHKLQNFCLRNACLIFCTASSSIKLCRNDMTPIKLVVIDEAAQLKECESVIPLQLPGVQNAVLVGDERQLPAMVQSKICEEAEFGRSLFERLVLLGHQKHLLNVQYRMHPSISQFPNAEFYNGLILDAPNVVDKAREKHFLREDMYGSYSFINVDFAKEELEKNNRTKNVLEVAVIAQIVANLFKESACKKQTLTVGCISPYKAQINALQAKLGTRYNRVSKDWSFYVNVRSVDGFQGSEEDVIIFSTVRWSIGFLSSRERANVALTRARHCLWIVGNKETMIKSGSVWNALVNDAENRGCVFDAHEDKSLAQVMVNAMVELADYFSLLKTDSILFKHSTWKVKFTSKFLQRTTNIRNLHLRKLLISLLVKLSRGWRQMKKNKINNYNDEQGMLKMFEIYSVNEHLYLVWSVDIAYENSLCFQVLKFWDILPLYQIQQLVHLESDFGNYTIEMINRCQTKRFERNLVFPMTWAVDPDHDDSTLVLTSQLANLSLNKQGS